MELTDKAREARNAYQREYMRNHTEKHREYNLRYWEKQANKASVTDNVTNKIVVTDNSNKLICAVCGASFIARRKDSKYCSPACKQKHYRQKS